MGLSGWRDPFVISTPNSPCPGHDDGKYTMLLGSGLKSTGGGAAMIYKSERLDCGEAGKAMHDCMNLVSHRCLHGCVPKPLLICVRLAA